MQAIGCCKQEIATPSLSEAQRERARNDTAYFNFQVIAPPHDMPPCNNTADRRYYENSLKILC
jgi:hypothetical protein